MNERYEMFQWNARRMAHYHYLPDTKGDRFVYLSITKFKMISE